MDQKYIISSVYIKTFFPINAIYKAFKNDPADDVIQLITHATGKDQFSLPIRAFFKMVE